MQLTFFIPALYQSLSIWQQDFAFQAKSSCLSELKFNTQSLPITSNLTQAIQYACGEVKQAISPAQIRKQASSSQLLCADPIHIETSMQGVTLYPKSLDMTAREAEVLCRDLNTFLGQDDLSLSVDKYSPQHWYLSGEGLKSLVSTPLAQVEQDHLLAALPQGTNKAYWHRLWSELQMLLHRHPVNQTRAAQGQKAINALWFWGEAPLPLEQYKEPSVDIVINGGVVAQAIASSCQKEYLQVDCFNQVNWEQGKRYLIVLDQLQTPAKQDNCQKWQDSLLQLEEVWLIPAIQALDNKQCDVSLIADDSYLLNVAPFHKGWRFWKNREFSISALVPPER